MLKADKALNFILLKYADFVYIFSKDFKTELPKYIRINDNVIKLIKSHQSSYGPIYNLGQVELKILKIYSKKNLVNKFIQPSKFLTNASIFFLKKPDESLQLCIDYRSLKNLNIKYWYSLPLINESLN